MSSHHKDTYHTTATAVRFGHEPTSHEEVVYQDIVNGRVKKTYTKGKDRMATTATSKKKTASEMTRTEKLSTAADLIGQALNGLPFGFKWNSWHTAWVSNATMSLGFGSLVHQLGAAAMMFGMIGILIACIKGDHGTRRY
jgi:hypothetical protein